MIRKLEKKFVQFLNNRKLRTKLMLSYFILIIIPLGLLAFVSYNQVSKTIEGLVLYSAKQNFEQTNSFLEYKISKIIDISDIITVDRNLNNILTKKLEDYEIAEQIKDAQDLNTLYLTPYQKEDDVYRLRLYVRDGVIYSQERINLFSMSDIENSKWYKSLISGKDKILWCPPEYFTGETQDDIRVVSAARIIRDPNYYHRIIGIFRIDMLESTIQSIIKKASITEKGVAYLQNEDGAVVTSSDSGVMEVLKADPSFCTALSKKTNNWGETMLKGKRILVGSKNLLGTDWTLVSVVPYEEILSSSKAIRNQLLMVLGILATLAYALAYYISGSSTKRIGQLIRRMRKAQQGELEVISAPSSKDEIGELVENFNFMIQKMEILIADQYRTGQEIKSAELKALQAQINPHFLYNTLDLINWTAIRNNVYEISSVVQSLAKFYKLSLSKGKDIVSIADEIMHVQLYVDIQNKRFENRILLHIEVKEEVLEYGILKIILQPIVENSILHGILEKKEKAGNITLTGGLEGDTIVLRVKDDGIGMKEEVLESILNNSATQESHGYGVRNINNRIKLHYGNEYGLSYKSEPGKGTEATMRFPAVSTRD